MVSYIQLSDRHFVKKCKIKIARTHGRTHAHCDIFPYSSTVQLRSLRSLVTPGGKKTSEREIFRVEYDLKSIVIRRALRLNSFSKALKI